MRKPNIYWNFSKFREKISFRGFRHEIVSHNIRVIESHAEAGRQVMDEPNSTDATRP